MQIISQTFKKKKTLNLSKTIINFCKGKEKNAMLINYMHVLVQHIVQSQNKSHNLIVTHFLNCSEFITEPLSSLKIRVFTYVLLTLPKCLNFII